MSLLDKKSKISKYLFRFKGKRKINLWSELKRKRQINFSFISVGLLALILVMVLGLERFPQPVPQLAKLASFADTPVTAPNLNDFSSYPNVEKFEVPNAKATVVYLPQIHKEPTSQPTDPINDQAAVAQKEIYQNLDKLVGEKKVSYVMDETDVYGAMPSDKVDKMKTGFQDIDNFNKATDKVIAGYLKDGGNQQTANTLKQQANTAAARYERNLYLTGGAAVLAAKNSDAKVYGSQVPATLDESKRELENLMYEQNRIAQLQQQQQSPYVQMGMGRSLDLTSILGRQQGGMQGGAQQPGAMGGNPMSNPNIQNIMAQLQMGGQSANGAGMFNAVSSFARTANDDQLTADIKEASQELGALSLTKSFESAPKFSEVPHNDSPYSNVNDLNALQNQYNADYAKFMKLIKDQRSQEAADNIEKMMSDNHVKSGALVMGAQHQDQLVDALNKKGISVIVVKTDAVKNYKEPVQQ